MVFYSFWGENGLGVFSKYDRMLERGIYVNKARYRKHNSLDEAAEYATEKFNELQIRNSQFPHIVFPEDLRVNWMMYINLKK